MTKYRSLQTIEAIQYTGTPIADVTCEPLADANEEAQRREKNGCDTNRAHLTHVHTNVPGGLTVLKHGDWISRVPGGPFTAIPDLQFRTNWEVSTATPKPEPDGGKTVTAPAPAKVAAPAEPAEQRHPEPAAAEETTAPAAHGPAGRFGGKVRGAGN